jgi:hypothetical protein
LDRWKRLVDTVLPSKAQVIAKHGSRAIRLFRSREVFTRPHHFADFARRRIEKKLSLGKVRPSPCRCIFRFCVEWRKPHVSNYHRSGAIAKKHRHAKKKSWEAIVKTVQTL